MTEIKQLQEERQKVKMMKMLNATISQDILIPILNIKLFADELLKVSEKRDNAQMIKYHRLISDASKLVSCRMKDLLDKSLIEQNIFVPNEITFSPQQVVD